MGRVGFAIKGGCGLVLWRCAYGPSWCEEFCGFCEFDGIGIAGVGEVIIGDRCCVCGYM